MEHPDSAGFAYPDILGAYEKMMQEDHTKMGITDDAMVLETMEGQKVKLVEGSYYNIKITTPEDWISLKSL